ncbi:ATP-binding cassette sub-family G member 4 [Blattella germanica]|nr:ATP-binding cassette sub-family G member 4 [Blattella germanica]
MGPSGAGKSSLLHILTGFINDGVEGTIRSSGRTVKGQGDRGDFRKEACYIMQENYLQPLFTVEDTLDTLSLSTCAETRCSKLSGGQSKRLSIALELLDNPPVMFLDEPTTGLDSVSALHCIKVLKSLTRGGRTIICTIHQPCASTLELLDQVYILNKGHCVYQGTPFNMLPYLRQFHLECPKYHNPADFMLEIVSGDHGDFDSELIEGAKTGNWKKPKETIDQITQQPIVEVKNEKDAQKAELDKARTLVLIRTPKEIDRFWILFKSFYTQLFRDLALFHVRFALHVAVGILLGLTFIQIGSDGSRTFDNVCCFFIMLTYLTYTSLIPAALRFPVMRDILSKETFNNWYKPKTYFIALIISSLPIQFLFSAVPVSLTYVLSAQPLEWFRFIRVVLAFFFTSLTAEGFGFFLGTICRPTMSTFNGALYTAFLVLFGGCLMLFGHMPSYIHWLSFFGFFRFTFDAVLSVLYSYNRQKLYCPEEEVICYLGEPKKILKEVGVSEDMYWVDISVLLLYCTLTRLVTYFTLKREIRKRH